MKFNGFCTTYLQAKAILYKRVSLNNDFIIGYKKVIFWMCEFFWSTFLARRHARHSLLLFLPMSAIFKVQTVKAVLSLLLLSLLLLISSSSVFTYYSISSPFLTNRKNMLEPRYIIKNTSAITNTLTGLCIVLDHRGKNYKV